MMPRVPADSPGAGSSRATHEGRGAVTRPRALESSPAPTEPKIGARWRAIRRPNVAGRRGDTVDHGRATWCANLRVYKRLERLVAIIILVPVCLLVCAEINRRRAEQFQHPLRGLSLILDRILHLAEVRRSFSP